VPIWLAVAVDSRNQRSIIRVIAAYAGINLHPCQANRCAEYRRKDSPGTSPLPLSDGPLLRHLALAAGIRERQPPRASGRQALSLRPSVPIRMAGAVAHKRRPLLYLLIAYGKPRNPPERGGTDRRAPRARSRLPSPTDDRPVGGPIITRALNTPKNNDIGINGRERAAENKRPATHFDGCGNPPRPWCHPALHCAIMSEVAESR